MYIDSDTINALGLIQGYNAQEQLHILQTLLRWALALALGVHSLRERMTAPWLAMSDSAHPLSHLLLQGCVS